jgi:DNA repair protein RecN (Recombination protein N)
MNLFDGEHGLNELFSGLISEIRQVKNFSGALEELYNRLESSYLELSDISNEVSKVDDQVEVNPQRADELNDRIALLYHLEQKHRVSGSEALMQVREDYRSKLGRFESLSEEIQRLEALNKELEQKLQKLATELSKKRHDFKKDLERKITEIISFLGMPDARIKLQIDKTQTLTESGTDQVTFLFNANRGMELQEMSKIASGGELSRLMLAIKSQIASSNLVSTIIFDEIDSGVSGEIAGRMAGIMQKLSEQIQVISITHLPQIAARGKNHYLVSKESDKENTKTSIRKLPQEDRIAEIAKMLSDSRVSSYALQTAAELMKN